MRRWHLFEFEDQSWIPASLRAVVTDILTFYLKLANQYVHAVPLLARLLGVAGTRQILDLCSGSGGPAEANDALLRANHGYAGELRLSDKFPALERVQNLDVTADSAPDFKMRTMYSAFHHFDRPAAQQILQRSCDDRAVIAIFEFTERSWRGLAFMLIGFPIVFLCSPFIQPFRWSRLFWVYVLPFAPLMLFWDGIVSALRTYSPKELIELSPQGQDYVWESGQLPGPGGNKVTYLFGIPHEKL